MPTRIDVARFGTGGQVDASLAATVAGASPNQTAGRGTAGDQSGDPPAGDQTGDPSAAVQTAAGQTSGDQTVGDQTVGQDDGHGTGGARGAAADTGGTSGWQPPSAAVLRGEARRGRLDVPGAQKPPVVVPRPASSDLSGLADLSPDARDALSALRAKADARALATLATLSPQAQAGLAALAAAPAPQPPAGLSALAGLSVADRAGLMRLTVSSGRPVVLHGSRVADLSATLTAPGGPAGPVRGRCGPTSGWAWFAGPATRAGHDPLLFLTNLGSVPARLEVHVLAPGGAPSVTEVAVRAGETVSRRLAAVAPEATATVVGVEVRAGRVFSWLVDRPSYGDAWDLVPVPATAAPARAVLVGPVQAPPGDGGADVELVVAAASADAHVRVRLVTASGRPASPPGLDAVLVPGGAATSIPLTLPRGEPVAVLVEARSAADVAAGATAGVTAGVVAGLRLPSGAPETAAAMADGADARADGQTWVAGVPVVVDEPAPGGGGPAAAGAGTAGSGTASPGTAGPGAARSDASGVGALPGRSSVPYLDVPPVPSGAAGALLLAAPGDAVTARLDGRTITIPGGRAVAVPLPAGYSGGTLSISGGSVGVTELLGTPADPVAGDDAPVDGSDVDSPGLGTVSSVLALVPADPTGPAVLVSDPSAAP